MYAILLSCAALILQLLPSVVTVLSPASITREEGKDAAFMFNTNTSILEAAWGIRDGDTNNHKLVLMTVDKRFGAHPTSNAGYAGRVSFVGNLTKGQAWFKITNLNINDTNQYMAKIRVYGSSNYEDIPAQLTVIKPPVLISNPGPLTREVGQDVVFEVNSTAMSEATWGVRLGDSNDLKITFYRVFNPGGAYPDTKINSTNYAGRVSFVGDLTKGQAWFKITHLNINDTNQYMALIILKGESSYRYIPMQLTVIIQPTTTRPIQASSTPPFQTTSIPSNITSTTISLHSTSTPENQSQPGDTCTSIIAACVTVIVVLVVVVVVLVVYIWKGKEKSARKRSLSSIKGEDLGAYEHAKPMDDPLNVRVHESAKARFTDKELYETICENRDKDTSTRLASTHPGFGALAVNEMTRHDSTASARGQDPLPSLPPQLYQELTNLPKDQQMPLYEPLNKGNTKYSTDATGSPRTYEQLQQNVGGREYQSLQITPNKEESKV